MSDVLITTMELNTHAVSEHSHELPPRVFELGVVTHVNTTFDEISNAEAEYVHQLIRKLKPSNVVRTTAEQILPGNKPESASIALVTQKIDKPNSRFWREQ